MEYKKIVISKWNAKSIENTEYLFFGCSKLISLPNISIWNTKNSENDYFMTA